MYRQKHLRQILLFVAIVVLSARNAFSQKNNLRQQPNIILFLVDDMGWEDASVPFADSTTQSNRKFYTPNMERLAAQGMKFTNAYATPLCSPTRVSLMTGMNAARTRVTNYCSNFAKGDNTDVPDSTISGVSWNVNGLSPIGGISQTVYATPLPELLRDGGYYTIHIGKGNFGTPGTPGASPRNLGFDVVVAGHAAGAPLSYLGQQNYGNEKKIFNLRAVPDLEEYFGSDTFLTEALTLEALKTLETPIRTHQPFFLYMSHYAVHQPLTADDRFYQKYSERELSAPEAKYASMIEGMDKSLGDIMDFIEKKGIEENTIIIFMSDNGGLALVPPRGGKPFTQNLPLRSGKGSVYEGGIREPMIVKWPGIVKPGSVSKQYLIIEDFFPTILEMAKVKPVKLVQTVDGKSFVQNLKNARLENTSRSLTWHEPNNWIPEDAPGTNFVSAIRKGKWKLIYLMKDSKLELYDLDRDIGEYFDLAGQYPDKVKELADELTHKLISQNAQMPTYKSTGLPIPWPNQLIGK